MSEDVRPSTVAGELVLAGARVVCPDGVMHGHLQVREGTIRDVAPGVTRVPGALDMEGDLLAPGLVELHSDNLERHLHPRPGVAWPMLPALLAHDAEVAGAGITTILNALRIDDTVPGDDAGFGHLVDALANGDQRDMMRSQHMLHIRAEVSVPGLVDALAPFAKDSRLRLVSLMDHSPGQRQFRDLALWKRYYRGKLGKDDAELERLAAVQRERAATYGADNRSRLSKLCRAQSIPLASHDDTTEEHIAEAAALGITVAEFPTTLEAAKAARKGGMATVAGAPNLVRGGSHSGNVAAKDLAAAELLDSLSSDYVPMSLLHAIFVLHDHLGGDLAGLFTKAARNPARMVGLADRGEIAVGQRADLIRIRPHPGAPVVRAVWRAGWRIA